MSTNKDKIRAAAQKYLQKGQLDKAIREFERLLEDDPNDVRTLLKIGDLQVRKGDQAAATKTYGNVAKYYSDQGFFLKAVAVYKQILKLDPALMDISMRLAELYHQLGLASDAIGQFRQICEQYEKNEKFEEAAAVVRKMVELDPEGMPGRLKLAELDLKLGKTEEAKAGLTRVATQLLKDQRHDEYIKVAERLFHVSPDDAVTARELARLYMERNDPRRALGKLQVCFHADPKDTEILAWLGRAFKDLGQGPKAVAALRELAAVQRDAGQTAAWTATLQEILAIDPDDADTRAALNGEEGASAINEPQVLEMESVELPSDDQSMELLAAEPLDDSDFVGSEIVQEPAPVAANDEAVGKLLVEVDIYIKYGLRNKAVEHLDAILKVRPEHREAQERLKNVLIDADDSAAAMSILAKMAQQSIDEGNMDRARSDVEELLGLDPSHPIGRALFKRLSAGKANDTPVAMHTPSDDDDTGVGVAVEFEAPGAANEGASFDGVSIEVDTEAPLAMGAGAMETDLLVSTEVAFEGEAPADAVAAASSLFDESTDEPLPPVALSPKAAAAPTASLKPTPEATKAVVAAKAPTAPQPPTKAQNKPAPEPVAAIKPTAAPRAPAKLSLDVDALVGDAVPAARPARAPAAPPPVTKAAAPATAPAATAAAPSRAPAAPPKAAPPVPLPDPVAADEPAMEIEDLSDELDEVQFFLQQGLEDEARDALENLASFYPSHPGVLALRAQLSGVGDEAMDEGPHTLAAAAEPVLQHDPARVEAALAEELAAVPQEEDDGQINFDDVFDQFKKGVEKQVDSQDFDTHFNLGIAYKEMGLLDDAIREFKLTSQAPSFEINALTMVGLCELQRGETEAALAAFMQGLSSQRVTAREVVALRYEIGFAYESMGHFADAAKFYEKACAMDPTFRDVSTRLSEVQAHRNEGPAASNGELDALLGDTAVRKSDKISYL